MSFCSLSLSAVAVAYVKLVNTKSPNCTWNVRRLTRESFKITLKSNRPIYVNPVNVLYCLTNWLPRV